MRVNCATMQAWAAATPTFAALIERTLEDA